MYSGVRLCVLERFIMRDIFFTTPNITENHHFSKFYKTCLGSTRETVGQSGSVSRMGRSSKSHPRGKQWLTVYRAHQVLTAATVRTGAQSCFLEARHWTCGVTLGLKWKSSYLPREHLFRTPAALLLTALHFERLPSLGHETMDKSKKQICTYFRVSCLACSL